MVASLVYPGSTMKFWCLENKCLCLVLLLLLLFLLLHRPSNKALLFSSLLPVFPPSFSICPLSTEQKREVEVIYGYNPPCTAKKVNLNEVIYYLWQVLYTQNCLSKRVFIDFPYLPCQPLDCHCLSQVDKQFKMAGCSPSPGPLLQRLAFICVLVLRTLAFSCLKLCVWEEPIPRVVQITQIRSKTFYTPIWKILASNRQ